MAYLNQIQPLYTVYYYSDFLYRVVKFKRSSVGVADRRPGEAPAARLSQSYSRSRSRVLQYALCNHWDHFITITVSSLLFDRYDLHTIYAALYGFFKYYRKTFAPDFRFLLVPELHKDGAWHFHGLVSGVVPSHLSKFIPGIHPRDLVDQNYDNWGMLAGVIGYLSLSEVVDPVLCGFYIAKYITKEHANDDFYEHLYYHSQGLKTAYPISDCYSYNSTLEVCLTYEFDFCSCGWAKFNKPDFAFPLQSGCVPREEEDLDVPDYTLDLIEVLEPEVVEPAFDPVQLTLSDMPPLDCWQLRPSPARQRD